MQNRGGGYRTVTIGGSTTHSDAVEDFRHSYPFQLDEHNRQNGYTHVQVINGGVGGYSSYHSLMNTQFRVLPLNPDLIVIYQGYNDIHTRFVYPNSSYLGDNSGYVALYNSNTVMLDILEYSTALRIIGIRSGSTKSHTALDWHRNSPASTSHRDAFLYQWAKGTYPSGVFADISAMEMSERNPPTHFERNLLNMIAVANKHDVDVLLVTFVTSTDFDLPVVASDEYIFALAQHNGVTRRIAELNSTPLFDLAAVFPGDSSLFTDGRHMTKEGNLIRARLIGDFVISEFFS